MFLPNRYYSFFTMDIITINLITNTYERNKCVHRQWTLRFRYRVTYFPLRGLAEPIRFLLAYGGIEFEDLRIAFEDWPNFKSSTPLGLVPLLEVDGKVAHQSIAICRYIAKQVKLVGNNVWEDLEIDAIVDTIRDLGVAMSQYWYEKVESTRNALKSKLLNETVPDYLQRLENIAKKNRGHLALDKLTWADLYFTSRTETFSMFIGSELLTNYPNLSLLREKVLALPGIREWMKRRPESDL